MMTFPRRYLALALLLLAPLGGRADDIPATEKNKIEQLIAKVEQNRAATFVRNGKEYDAKTAATFLRRKWKANEDRITSAKDFVEQVGSKSSTSGKPYLIRFKDGTEKKSREFLLAELGKLEKSRD